MTTNIRSSCKIEISGQVQGVDFRLHTKQIAEQLGLVGFVKNINDGGVLIQASGEMTALGELVRWCHAGSERAAVDDVVVKWNISDMENYKRFVIEH